MEENKGDFFEDTQKLLTNYVDDRIFLLKIQAAEKTGKFASTMINVLVIALIFFFVVLFFSVVGALYFSELLGSYLKGFGMMLAIYVAVLISYLILNKVFISKKIMNSAIKMFFDPSKAEQELTDEDDE
jgi:hypothetical protein